MDEKNFYQNPILQAALRPEFQDRHFNPDDYELVDGYPLRKDRFKTFCANVAVTLYNSRVWSMVALRRHMTSLLGWWGALDDISQWQDGVGKVHSCEWVGMDWSLVPMHWLDVYQIENHSINEVACGEFLPVDLVLVDGSYLCGAKWYPAHITGWSKEQARKMPKGTQLTFDVPSRLLWKCGDVNVEISPNNVVKCNFNERTLVKLSGFLTRFTRTNLRDDVDSQLEVEKRMLSKPLSEEIAFKTDFDGKV